MCGRTSRFWHALEVEKVFFDILKMVVCWVPRRGQQGTHVTVQHFGGRPIAIFTLGRLIQSTLFEATLY